MLAARGDSSEDEEGSEAEKADVALMARSDTDSDDESTNSLTQLKKQGMWSQ